MRRISKKKNRKKKLFFPVATSTNPYHLLKIRKRAIHVATAINPYLLLKIKKRASSKI
jgi:hypothetical protein